MKDGTLWAGRVTGLGDQRFKIAMMPTPEGDGRLERASVVKVLTLIRANNTEGAGERPPSSDGSVA